MDICSYSYLYTLCSCVLQYNELIAISYNITYTVTHDQQYFHTCTYRDAGYTHMHAYAFTYTGLTI